MESIKVFLASSYRFLHERNLFTKVANKINYSRRKTTNRIEIVRWEHIDPSMNSIRKQDEYNKHIGQCEFVVVIIDDQTVGQYTTEEYIFALKSITEHSTNVKELIVYAINRGKTEIRLKSQILSDAKKNSTITYVEESNIDDILENFATRMNQYLDEKPQVCFKDSAHEGKQIFLYTSTDMLEEENGAVNDFIHQYNKIKLQDKPELFVVDELSQAEASEIAIVLYYNKYGRLTKSNFDKLYSYITNSEMPLKKIHVFFKEPDPSIELESFKKIFAVHPYDHFYSTFMNPEKIKIELLFDLINNIQNYKIDGSNLMSENDEVICSLEEYVKMSSYGIKDKLESKKKFKNRQIELIESGDYHTAEFQQISSELTSLNEEISKVSQYICEIAQFCCADDDQEMDELQTLVRHKFKEGDFKEIDRIIKEFRDNEYKRAPDQSIESINSNYRRRFELLDLSITSALSNYDLNIKERNDLVIKNIADNIKWAIKASDDGVNIYYIVKDIYYKYMIILSESFDPVIDSIEHIKMKLTGTGYNMADAYRLCGNYYWRTNKFDQANLNYTIAQSFLMIDNSIDTQLSRARLLNDQGCLHVEFEQFEDAIRCYTEALDIYSANTDDTHTNKNEIASVYNDLGRLYRYDKFENKDYDRSIGYLKRSIEIRQKLVDENDKLTMSRLTFPLNNIALAMLAKANISVGDTRVDLLNQALAYINEAESIIDKYCNALREIEVKDTKAKILYQLDDDKQAKEIYESTHIICNKIDDVRRKADFFLSYAKFEIAHNNLADAEELINEAIRIYTCKNIGESKEIHDSLIESREILAKLKERL